MNSRINNVKLYMNREGINRLLITDPYSIFYLIGKWFNPGERLLMLLIDANGNMKLFLNRLFPASDDLEPEIIWYSDSENPFDMIACNLSGVVGVDKNMPARFLLPLMQNCNEIDFVEGSYIVDDLRGVKDKDEIEKMIKASEVNDAAMDMMKRKLSENLSEEEMAKYLLTAYESLGSNYFSFEPIIAYGVNASDPHHENDNSLKKEGDCIVVDMGCLLDGYCSDMTRTFFYKNVSEKAKEVYETVLAANLAGIAKVKPGVRFCDIDKATRDVIENAGYGEYFTHRTGHFIGLETHDKGDISSANTKVAEVGNIFSIEPGIYIPGVVGVRIEDLVLVTEDGCKVLNNYPKKLTIVE